MIPFFRLNINRILHLFELRTIRNKNRSLFLTFDDGPEPGITEFILNELDKYGFHATFFCRGDNAEKYPELLQLISNKGHSIGNHTYNHINSFYTPNDDYVKDVERADNILHTKLFRPPWGSITLSSFLRLKKKYLIVYWSLISGDTKKDGFVKEILLDRLKTNTKSGDVVLFHFCQEHETRTKQLLPEYLSWLSNQDYHCRCLESV